MLNVCYPAVFHLDNNMTYWVEFPDLDGCFSDGKTIEEAYINSKEALAMYLDKSDDTFERTINEPRNISKVIKKYKNELVLLVECDSIGYAKKYKNRAVKKTLSIPEWLNDLAIANNINFSNLLQEALLSKLSK